MEMPNHLEMLARFDQELIYMNSEQYTRFAEDTIVRERAVVEKLRAAGKVA
jgi:Tripartite tricarboxylate transporter family receptor